jgi:hypothetical protein
LEGRGFCHRRLYPNFKSRTPPLKCVKDRAPNHRVSQIEVDLSGWYYSPVKLRYEETKGRATRPRKSRVRHYTAFLETNEHAGYTVTVPLLPGLVTEGKDLENSRSMAMDAI